MTANNLIKKLILLCMIEVLLGALICYTIPADQEGYIAAIEDKESLLLNSKPPRVIFVGGSNLVFGLDSELVEKKLGLSVINFGLHAGLGLETSLNVVAEYAAQGDIIVIVPEYEYFEMAKIMYGTDDLIADFLEINPANIQYVAVNKWIDLPLVALNIPERKLNRKLNAWLTPAQNQSIYTRSNFNRYGDMIGHLGEKSLDPNIIPHQVVLQPETPLIMNSFDILEKFHQKMIDKGVIVLFDFPSLRKRNFEDTRSEEFDDVVFFLKTRTTIPILSTPYERCYPDNYFYNTRYHLNDVGREIRTQQMIKSLSTLLK